MFTVNYLIPSQFLTQKKIKGLTRVSQLDLTDPRRADSRPGFRFGINAIKGDIRFSLLYNYLGQKSAEVRMIWPRNMARFKFNSKPLNWV